MRTEIQEIMERDRKPIVWFKHLKGDASPVHVDDVVVVRYEDDSYDVGFAFGMAWNEIEQYRVIEKAVPLNYGAEDYEQT